VSIEVESGRKLAESVVKSITGGDTISARFLHKEAFEFRPAMKLWLAANDRPWVRDDDAAMWRRILQIPFAIEIPAAERDPEVKTILADAAVAGPAILAWAVEGCLAWRRHGLGVPPAVRAATDEYRAAMDPIAEFVQECLEFDPAAFATSSELWEAFVGFHDRRPPIKRKRFGQCLAGRGLQDYQEPSGKRRRCWGGVRLRGEMGDERIGTH
jgi:putative DNA primase/helicase